MTRANSVSVRKMVLTAMLAGLGFVLSTFVYFPSMAPFQHFCNIIGAVFLGPWYGFAAALLTGLLRMLTGRTIQAVVGAVIGAFLSGLLYQKTKRLWCAYVGEVAGTGILSALAAYPLMKQFYGLDAQSPLYYIPAYLPSSAVGGLMGCAVILLLKRSGALDRMLNQLER
ncbi:energy coupling factor transporter S component ThiW [Pseudoflavonifractor sp. MSJ-37]|nr:energy coupling factor transporter S component ThiW [Pseudoflavonifractor sp. MSJ-37]MBU5435131.1 energy coupling factor transporter S component ThiW [Pseudoflavonifractor sp. MSJ-37]